MYQVAESPEHYRLWEALAREAAARARSDDIRQRQLELADNYNWRAEQDLTKA